MVTSVAMATSGSRPNALVRAPLRPTSSCTVPTAWMVAFTGRPFSRCRAETIMATPARLSKALPVTKSLPSLSELPVHA